MTDPITGMQNAQRLLDDPTFHEAFAKVEDAILAKLREPATPHDTELLMALRLMPKIKGWLIGQVETGKVELSIRDAEAKGRNSHLMKNDQY